MLLLIKYLVSSYSSIRQIKNKHFLNILKDEICEKVPSYKRFRYEALPEVFTILRKFIDNILNKATYITLVVDIWTNAVMADFLGLAAVVTYEIGHKELVIIGLGKMKGFHDAGSIKKTIESLVNVYSFDKKKISCKFFCC